MSANPSRFETLDSAAFAKGRAWDSHGSRTIVNAQLRLRRKEQCILCLGVAVTPARDFALIAADGWVRVLGSFQVPKNFVSQFGFAVLAFNATNPFLLQFVSRARPYDETINVGATGLGLATSTTGTDLTGRVPLPLLRGAVEELSVFVRPTVAGVSTFTPYGLSVVALREGTT